MKLLDAVYEELKKAGTPMTAREIAELILKSGAWSTNGKTPDASVGSKIYTDIKDNGAKSRFVKIDKGLFALSGGEETCGSKPKQAELFNESDSPKVATSTSVETGRGMTSKFYEPALAILKGTKGKKWSATDVCKAILAQFPEVKWGGTQGPIRAMLLSAVRHETPIKQVEGSRPPLFYYDGNTDEGGDAPSASPEEIIEEAISQSESRLKEELLAKVMAMDDTVFEELVNQLIERLGFGTHYTTPPSHDGGIDGMIYGDSLGLNVVCVQAKHYTKKNVERGEIDAFIGALEGRNGVFVTTTSFSKGAKDRAEHNRSASRIALIDGERLTDLMLKYNLGVQETDKKFVLKRIDNDFFEELEG